MYLSGSPVVDRNILLCFTNNWTARVMLVNEQLFSAAAVTGASDAPAISHAAVACPP
jgi:hypothetical protein